MLDKINEVKPVSSSSSSSFSSGSGLRCYKCADYTGRCQNVQECTYEDSCISLSERGQLSVCLYVYHQTLTQVRHLKSPSVVAG